MTIFTDQKNNTNLCFFLLKAALMGFEGEKVKSGYPSG